MVDVHPELRFRLNATQLSSALSLAGVSPDGVLGRARLTRVADPKAGLADSPALESNGRELVPTLVAALRVLARPECQIVCATNVAGSSKWQEHQLFGAPSVNGCFAGLLDGGETYVVQVLPDSAAVIDHLASAMQLRAGAGPSESVSAVLDDAGCAALAAAADATQSVALRARLERMGDVYPILSASTLEREWERGTSRLDTRWMVSALQRLAAEGTWEPLPPMAAGLASLQRTGLVRPVQRGWSFTTIGLDWARAFGMIDALARFELSVRRAEQWSACARFGLCSLGGRLGFVRWQSAQKPANVVFSLSDPASVCQQAGEALAAACATLVAGPPTNTSTVVSFSHPAGPPAAGAKPAKQRRSPPARAPKASGASAKRIDALSENDSASVLRCVDPSCGAVLAAGKKFCTACGTPVPKGGA